MCSLAWACHFLFCFFRILIQEKCASQLPVLDNMLADVKHLKIRKRYFRPEGTLHGPINTESALGLSFAGRNFLYMLSCSTQGPSLVRVVSSNVDLFGNKCRSLV